MAMNISLYFQSALLKLVEVVVSNCIWVVLSPNSIAIVFLKLN